MMWYWTIFVFIVLHGSGAQVEETCVTPNQKVGKCISIYSCKELIKLVLSNNRDSKKFVKNSFCGWGTKHDPLVCCGTKTPLSDLLPDKNTCGFQQDFNKILGGKEANLDEFPWTALLMYTNNKFDCGGILISKRYVLTAGHCTEHPLQSLVSVRLGEWKLNSTNDCVGSPPYEQCMQAVDIDVETVTLHENYKFTRTVISNDIALIRLKNEVNFTGHIQPICLPENSLEKSNPGDKLWVSGWGTNNSLKLTNSMIKQKVWVPIVQLQSCKQTYDRYYSTIITDAQLCAGGEIGKDACVGDSGGPLMTRRKENPLQFYVEGIVSFGISCGSNIPGIYTRVSAYLDWIKQNMKA